MSKARDTPNVTTLSRVIQVVKNVFIDKHNEKKDEGKKEKDGENEEMEDNAADKKQQQKIFSQALNSDEYKTLIKFFAQELPTLALKLAGIKEFPPVDKLVKYSKKMSFDVKKQYKDINMKTQTLLKSYSANYNRLLAQALAEETVSQDFMAEYFTNGPDVAKCCMPFKVYAKKLAVSCAKVSVGYSKLNQNVIMLAFNTLRSLTVWSQDDSLFEDSLKRMYNEFARECKVGGGGFAVQNSLRTCQNCFIELLSLNRSIGYQLGFQYLRQLCMHLRTIRNNMVSLSFI